MKVLDYPNGGKPAFVYTFEMFKYENSGSSDDAEGNKNPQSSQDTDDTKGEDSVFFDFIAQFFTAINDFFISIFNALIYGVEDADTTEAIIFNILTYRLFLLPLGVQKILLLINVVAWITINNLIGGFLVLAGETAIIGIIMIPFGTIFHINAFNLLSSLVEKLHEQTE